MTSYTLSPVWGAGAQLFDNSGNVLTGGKIETYEAGTTTNAVTYADPTGSTFNSNPIIADASGRLSNEIWLPVGISYKFVLKDANNVLIATYDNIGGSFNASAIIANFTGNGLTVAFTLASSPANENSTNVFINGVYQQKNTYSVAGAILTFSEAPPTTSTIEVSYT